MSKRVRKVTRRPAGTGATAAVAERNAESSQVIDKEGRTVSGKEGRTARGRLDAKASASARPRGGSPGRGFFEIYKPGQGRNTRMWSAVGYGALVCWFAYFMWDKLSVVDAGQYTQVIQVGVAVAVVLVFGLFGYWALGLNKRANDFLIATEGEMKKVNWTSRKEIIGSTKVVIVVVVSMALLLFLVDIFFMSFFTAIGVLKGTGFFEAIREAF